MTSVDQARDIPLAAPAPPVPVRPSSAVLLREIGQEIWGARELVRQLVIRDLRVRYKQAALGVAWAVFMPALIVASGVLVRLAMSQVTSSTFDRATVGALALKGLAWGFVVGAIGVSTPSITGNGNLITKVYFPREVLPVAAILAQGFDTTVGSLLFLVIAPFLGAQIGVNLLWVPVVVALIITFVLATGLLLSSGNVFFRDVKYIVQMLLTFGIFFTPVFFEASMLGELGSRIVMLNPLAPLLEGLRLSVIEGHNLLQPLTAGGITVWEPFYLGYSATVAIIGLMLSALFFHRMESTFPEYV